MKRFLVPMLLVCITTLMAIAMLKYPMAIWLLIPSSFLVLIAIWDTIQTRHSLRRNYPLLGRARWLFEDLRPYLRSYIVESDLDGRPFSRNERALVYARAKDDISSHPFGTELNVYSEEHDWLNHSIFPNENIPTEFRIMWVARNASGPTRPPS